MTQPQKRRQRRQAAQVQRLRGISNAGIHAAFMRRLALTICALVLALAAMSAITSPALALDLNSFRAENKLPPLSYSATLAGAASGHARDMAKRNSLDHNGFKERAKMSGGAAAENVSYGCDDQDCAIKQWAKSSGHRKNMLMKGVSSYGIASATSDSGRKYWAMMLGN